MNSLKSKEYSSYQRTYFASYQLSILISDEACNAAYFIAYAYLKRGYNKHIIINFSDVIIQD